MDCACSTTLDFRQHNARIGTRDCVNSKLGLCAHIPSLDFLTTFTSLAHLLLWLYCLDVPATLGKTLAQDSGSVGNEFRRGELLSAKSWHLDQCLLEFRTCIGQCDLVFRAYVCVSPGFNCAVARNKKIFQAAATVPYIGKSTSRNWLIMESLGCDAGGLASTRPPIRIASLQDARERI